MKTPKFSIPIRLVVLVSLIGLLALFMPPQSGLAEPQDTTRVILPVIYSHFSFAGPAYIRGRVYSALVGKEDGKLPNAEVCLRGTSTCVYSNEDGDYFIDDLISSFQILDATKEGFLPLARNAPMLPGENVIDLPLSPQIESNQYRIVVSWVKRVDLDANLWLPVASPYHVMNIEGENAGVGNCFGFPYACIDIDSVDGSSPESITISVPQPGEYVYAIRHYTFASQPGEKDPALAFGQIGVTVDVYNENGLVTSFQPEATDDPFAIWWHVFDIGESGEIIVINEVSSAYPVPQSYPADRGQDQ